MSSRIFSGLWPCLAITVLMQFTNFGILILRSAMHSDLNCWQQALLTSLKELDLSRSLMQAKLNDFCPVLSPGLVFLSGWQKLTRGTFIFCAMVSKWWWQKALIFLLLFLLFPKYSFSAYLKALLKKCFWYSSGRFFALFRSFTFSRTIRYCSFNCCSSMSFNPSLSSLLRRMSRLVVAWWVSGAGVAKKGSISSGRLPVGVGKAIISE